MTTFRGLSPSCNAAAREGSEQRDGSAGRPVRRSLGSRHVRHDVDEALHRSCVSSGQNGQPKINMSSN
jgi:hypothetical protein